MKTCLALFLALVLVNLLHAQTSLKGSNYLSISPFRAANLVNPGIELNFARIYAGRHATQISYRALTDIFHTTPYEKFKGSGFGIEQKYFLAPVKKRELYLSVSYDHSRVKYETLGEFQLTPGTNYADSIRVDRNTDAFHFNIGRILYFKKFFADISLGIGVKHKDTRHSGRISPGDKEERSRHFNAYDLADREGNYFMPELPLMIRVGYRF
ncbi:MAG TPA: hypothetical protein VGO58_04425 [Chitinophagaceae bacterium]|jgi:hypothetical protein|nr:hypothetical protein [Chitinophagaceae bacterium]